MRILRVAQKVYPDATGGGAYHVHAMSRDQAARGHEVTVLTVDHDGDRPGREDRDGYTVVRYPPTLTLAGNAMSAGLARHLRAADGFDVVHAHSHLYFSTNLAAATRLFGDTPLAITNHGLYSQSAPEWVFSVYLRTLGRVTFDAADVVFCYTDVDARRVRELGVDSRIEVVHNGIDTERFSPAGASSVEVQGDPALLFVGRLVEGKRPGDAVAALERVREPHPDARLTVVGDGERRAGLAEQVAEAGLGDAVTFLGRVDYDRMPAVYRAADLLVLPSAAEGFPRTVLEALRCGTPAVVSELDQMADIAGTGVWTVPVGDVAALADRLTTVLGDGDGMATAGRRGSKLVAERYEWAETVERTTAVLVDLVD